MNIKWLAEYTGTSVAMIEKHYGKYIKSDSGEQLRRVFQGETGTLSNSGGDEVNEVLEKWK